MGEGINGVKMGRERESQAVDGDELFISDPFISRYSTDFADNQNYQQDFQLNYENN